MLSNRKKAAVPVVLLLLMICILYWGLSTLFSTSIAVLGYSKPDAFLFHKSLLSYWSCPHVPLVYVDGYGTRNDTTRVVGVCLTWNGVDVVEGYDIQKARR